MKSWTAPVVAGLCVVGCSFFDFPAPERAPEGRNDGGETGTRTGGGGASGTSGASGMAGNGMTGVTAGDSSEGGTSGSRSGAAGAGDGGAAGAGEGGASGSTAGGTSGNAGGGGAPTEPLIPGLKLWLDAASLPGNGPLVTWPNRITNGETDASQPGGDLRPVLGTFEGRRGVSFNGGQWMTFGEGFENFSGGLTLFVVARFDAPAACTEVFQVSNGIEMDDISLQTDLAIAEPGALLFEVGNVNIRTDPRVLDGTDPAPRLATAVVRLPDEAFLFIDTIRGAMQLDPLFVPGSVPRVENYLGSGLYENCDPFEGVIFELLLYNRGLTVDNIAQVSAYLRQKWNCCDG